MGEPLSSLIAPFETELGGVLLANMLEAWLDVSAGIKQHHFGRFWRSQERR